MPTFRAPSPRVALSVASAAVLMMSCNSDNPAGPTPPDGRTLYGVTLDNRLLRFNSALPGTILTEVPVTGMPSGQRLVSIDIRPADGEIYGVGTDNRVYRVHKVTGVATAVGEVFSPSLDGEHFGLAITSGDDRIRTSSVEGDQNLLLNPADGSLIGVGGSFAFAAGDANAGTNIGMAALANMGSTLYGIESNVNVLVLVTDPAAGTVTTIGSLGVNTVPCAAFDIDPSDSVAFASLALNGISTLYTVNLTTGAATPLGVIDIDSEVQGLAIE
ncbi:MAG TPA: DUF4394 domain-containing protein [Gemmatimonadaceae bacterium]